MARLDDQRMDTQDVESHGRDIDESGARKFRACRICKRQKVRCEGQEHAPCRRCRAAGVACVFDLIREKRRENKSHQDDASESERVRLLEQELQSLRGVVNDLAQCRPPGYGRSLAISNNIVGTTPLYQPGTKEPNPHRSVNATLPPPWPKPGQSTPVSSGANAQDPRSPLRRVNRPQDSVLDPEQVQGVDQPLPASMSKGIQDNASTPPPSATLRREPLQNQRQNTATKLKDNQDDPSRREQYQLNNITHDDLCAPLSAVAAMAVASTTSEVVDDEEITPSHEGYLYSDDTHSSLNPLSQALPLHSKRLAKRQRTSESAFGLSSAPFYEDIISRHLLSEPKARELFNLFFAGCGDFLPLLDPNFDSFDSLRARSSFCFIVVLFISSSIAAVQDPSLTGLQSICYQEARSLAAATLFKGVSPIESIQAMVLMAAYSTDNWLAIGHAVRMAQHARLDQSLPLLLGTSSHVARVGSIGPPSTNKSSRVLACEARTWLILFHIEQEISSGMARPSLLREVDVLGARALLDHSLSQSSDVRFISTIELVILRGQCHRDLVAAENLPGSAASRIASMAEALEQWLSTWDQIHADRGYHKMSFQRASLQIQRTYAEIFICCTMLGKLQAHRQTLLSPEFDDDELDGIIVHTVNTIKKQLNYVLETPCYKWSLKWAPTYSALTIAFATVFASKVMHLRPDLVDRPSFLSLSTQVANLLLDYPTKSYYRLVHLLNALPQANPPARSAKLGDLDKRPPDTPASLEPTLSSFKAIWGASPTNVALTNQTDIAAQDEAGSLQYGQNITNTGTSFDCLSWVSNSLRPSHSSQPASGTHQATGIEVPSWMLDWAHIESFGLPERGNASMFDFDMPLALTPPAIDFDHDYELQDGSRADGSLNGR